MIRTSFVVKHNDLLHTKILSIERKSNHNNRATREKYQVRAKAMEALLLSTMTMLENRSARLRTTSHLLPPRLSSRSRRPSHRSPSSNSRSRSQSLSRHRKRWRRKRRQLHHIGILMSGVLSLRAQRATQRRAAECSCARGGAGRQKSASLLTGSSSSSPCFRVSSLKCNGGCTFRRSARLWPRGSGARLNK